MLIPIFNFLIFRLKADYLSANRLWLTALVPIRLRLTRGTFLTSTSYRSTVICYETDNLYGSELVPVPDSIPCSEPR